MNNLSRITEELKYYGATNIGSILSQKQIEWYKEDLLQKKQADIKQFGIETLSSNFSLETISDLGRFAGEYYELISNEKLNGVVNKALNDKAVIHSYNAIILASKGQKSEMVGHRFHRDMPWFPDCRTSIIIMIPLVDYGMKNGATQFVPGSHLFREMPSEEFMLNHAVTATGKAGEAFMIDSTTWHRAGDNRSGEQRPMIVIKYTLAPFKQQIEFYLSNKDIETAPDIVKQRLGWNVRVPHDYLENRVWEQSIRKFKSGQYDMSNTYLK